MASSLTNDISSWYLPHSIHVVNRPLGFLLFFILDLFGIAATTFVLYHLLSKRTLRQALHNHAPIIIFLLVFIYEVINIPLHLQFLSTGVVRPTTPEFCHFWWFIDWGFFFIITVLLAFASFERHILIFHSHMVATKRKRLLLHYFPLLFIILFMTTFYSIAIFAPICESTFDYTLDLCGTHACYGEVPFFTLVEQIGFSAITCFLIAIFSIMLLLRVIWQKHRVHQPIPWRKQRKLTVQMIFLSLLYLIFSLPNTIIYLVRLFAVPDWADEVLPLFFFLSYFSILLLPLVGLASLPELWKKVKSLDPRRRRVGPVIVRP